jgi:ribosome-associated protein
MIDPIFVGHVVVPPEDLSWTAVRASGPGGQNVNKVSSKVVLRFDLAATRALDGAAKARLRAIAHGRLDADGAIVVTSQRTRDQRLNLEDARSKLAELVARALVVEAPRRPTKPTRASKRRRVDDKRRHGEKKRGRRDRGE